MYDDTIAAIATPPGEGGIGTVRLSGPEALPILRQVFVRASGRPLDAARARWGGDGGNRVLVHQRAAMRASTRSRVAMPAVPMPSMAKAAAAWAKAAARHMSPDSR